jgi:hypothetical protein
MSVWNNLASSAPSRLIADYNADRSWGRGRQALTHRRSDRPRYGAHDCVCRRGAGLSG